MAETIATPEELAEISAVIQVSPHNNETELKVLSVNEDGEPLVSLDELYDKTGQESICLIIEGMNSLVKRNKLSPANAKALKIQGTESWVPGYDRMNAIKGGEGFLSTVRDKAIEILKAIIKFVKGIWNWVVVRVRALLGLGKTAGEAAFIAEKSREINENTENLFGIMGARTSYVDALVNNANSEDTFLERMKVMQIKTESWCDLFESMYNEVPNIEKALNELQRNQPNMVKAKTYLKQKHDNFFKNIERAKSVTDEDMSDFIIYLEEGIWKYLDPNSLIRFINIANKALLSTITVAEAKEDKELEGLKDRLNLIRKHFNDEITTGTTGLLTTKVISQMKERQVSYIKNIAAGAGKTIVMDQSSISSFKDYVAQTNVDKLALLDSKFKKYDLLKTYNAFSLRLTQYINLYELAADLLGKLMKFFIDTVDVYNRVVKLTAIYAINDVAQVKELIAKNYTKEELANLLDEDGDLRHKWTGDFQWKKRYGTTMMETISEFASSPGNNKQVDNWIGNIKRSIGKF